MFGLYLHIPFCASKCWYCDFNSYAGLDQLAPRYVAALEREMAGAPATSPVTSTFRFAQSTRPPSLVIPDTC